MRGEGWDRGPGNPCGLQQTQLAGAGDGLRAAWHRQFVKGFCGCAL